MIRRGDIHWVDLDPSLGSESSKRRPAIVVSNDVANLTASRLGRGVVTVVPITSNVDRIYPFQVALPGSGLGLDHRSKAQAEQIRSIDVRRLGERIGIVPGSLMERLDEALRLHLGL